MSAPRYCNYCGDKSRPLVRGIDGTRYHAGRCRYLAKRDQDAARIAGKRADATLTRCIVCQAEGAMVWSRLLYPVGADGYLSHEAEICGTRCCLKWQASTGQPFPDSWSRLDVTDDEVRQAVTPRKSDFEHWYIGPMSAGDEEFLNDLAAGRLRNHNNFPSGQAAKAA